MKLSGKSISIFEEKRAFIWTSTHQNEDRKKRESANHVSLDIKFAMKATVVCSGNLNYIGKDDVYGKILTGWQI